MPRRKMSHHRYTSSCEKRKRGEEIKGKREGNEAPKTKFPYRETPEREKSSEHSPSRSERGHISKLPDEVLLLVFSHLDSFLDRLRVAKVDKRFRKCIFKAMKTPQPLKLDFEKDLFCGDELSKTKWSAVLQVLAKEARFNSIEIEYWSAYPSQSPDMISPLISVPDCLSHLTTILISNRHFLDPDLTGLDSVLAKCSKLSVLKLSQCINLQSPTDPFPDNPFPTLDLASSLKDKPITELDLDIADCTEGVVIDVLHALRPNALQKLCLRFVDCQSLELVSFVRVLCHTAAQTVQEIRFYNQYNSPFHCPLNQLFSCVADLSSLRVVSLYDGKDLQQLDEFIPAVRLLLDNHTRTTPLVVDYQYLSGLLYKLPFCQWLSIMHPLLQDLPETVFRLHMDNGWWKLNISLEHTSLQLHIAGPDSCDHLFCHPCRSFFPIVLSELSKKAFKQASYHLENYWLDRCRIDRNG